MMFEIVIGAIYLIGVLGMYASQDHKYACEVEAEVQDYADADGTLSGASSSVEKPSWWTPWVWPLAVIVVIFMFVLTDWDSN